jgi:CRP-like cAMP-binding protein
MDAKEIIIRIVEENQCPLYHLGDEFGLKGNALDIPHDKRVCLILVKDITELMSKQGGPVADEIFYCSGCTGRIKMAYVNVPDAPTQSLAKSREELAAIVGLLAKFDIFKNLEREDIEDIISFLKLKRYSKDDIVIRKGDIGRNLYILASGRVEVLGDNSVSIAFLGSGEVFGDMSLLSGEPVAASIRVVEPTRILYISARDFRQVMTRHPGLQMYFARLLTQRLTNTNAARAEEISSGMVGKLTEMTPSEIFQSLNANQKTGVLVLELTKGTAKVAFRDGELVRVEYNRVKGKDAFFEILRERKGQFKFLPTMTEDDLSADPLGDFMWLMMEGARMIDEGD